MSRVKHTLQVHPILEPQEGGKANSSSNSPINFSGVKSTIRRRLVFRVTVYHNHQQTSTHPPMHPPPAVPDKQVELELDPRTHLVDSLVVVNPVALAARFPVWSAKKGGMKFLGNVCCSGVLALQSLDHPTLQIRATKRIRKVPLSY